MTTPSWDDTSRFDSKYYFEESGLPATEADYQRFREAVEDNPFDFENRPPAVLETSAYEEAKAAPIRGRFLTAENVANISRAILATKEGKIGLRTFNQIVADNLPEGFTMDTHPFVGEVYTGSLGDHRRAVRHV